MKPPVSLEREVTKRYCPYPKYKDSGVEWLGRIPEGWELLRLKHTVLCCKNGVWGDEVTGNERDIACIRVSDFDRTKKKISPCRLTIRNFDGLRVNNLMLQNGDLLLEKSGGGEKQPVGCVVLFDLDIPAVCSNFIARMSVRKSFYSRFLCYLHEAIYELGLIRKFIKQSIGIQNLDNAGLLNVKVAVPDFNNQVYVAKFLDKKTTQIDTLIAKKERLIELLEEKRSALISRAVTKGLAPDVPMKDSGIDWLGQVPEHWEISRLKFMATLQTGITLGKKYENRSLASRPYLRVANVQNGYLNLEDVAEILLPPEDVGRYELQMGDVLMTEGGDFDKLGRGAVWEAQISGCLHQNHIFAVRPDGRKLNPKFLALLLGSSHGRNYFTYTSQQTTNLACTNSTKLGNFPLVIPPVSEQLKVLGEIRAITEKLDSLVEKTRRSIELLKEYRTALITAAVTGKIDVREEVAS